jgi:hypothetical protein
MMQLYTRNCTIKNLMLTADDSFVCAIGIDCTKAIGAGAGICTQMEFDSVAIRGRMTYHWRMSADIGAGQPVNCENHTWRKCFADGNFTGTISTSACMYVPNATGQSKAWTFYDCQFWYAQLGMWVDRCSWLWTGGLITGHTVAAVQRDYAADRAMFVGVDSEGCARFLVDAATGNASAPITLQSSRFSPDLLAVDGRYIVKNNGGPLVIDNCYFDPTSLANDANFKIEVGIGTPGTSVICTGTSFPNANPIDCQNVARVWFYGNRGYGDLGAGVVVFPVNDYIGGNETVGAAYPQTLAMAGVRSIGSGRRLGNNLRGTVLIADANTNAAVTFATAEPDANYQVWLTIAARTGAPAAGAYIPIPTTALATTGFTVNLTAAPGAGTDVTYNWLVIR